MKYLVLSLVVVFSLLACSETFNLIAPKEEIPIVNGFLSATDTAQYIKVQRAFRDQDVPAVELAQIPDSLYYDNATVTITNEADGTVYTLTRVNGNDEGFVKEEGAFADDPNYLYKIMSAEMNLIPGNEYTLEVNTGEQGMAVASSTITLGEIPRLTTPRQELDYAFSTEAPSNMAWREVDDIVLYDVNMILNILERDATDPEAEFIPRSLRWNVGRNIEDERLQVSGTEFFGLFAANLEENPDIIRRFVNFDTELVGGGQELADFINVTEANTGITSSGETPIFTNIENGVGFFSTRNTLLETGIIVTENTLDSLAEGSLTRLLNFQ